jgi:glycosyltransferase involved in cell wall biosynthesis
LPLLPVVLPWPAVRILLDYRPALRERTGVGEYAHELAAALLRVRAPGDTLTLFSSSWKDRLPPDRLPGARVVDRRVPVTVLNAAWHRLGWPPAELFAGDIDVVHSLHPLLMPARRAAQVITIHDLDFLDHPERTRGEIRRDYGELAAAHARRAAAVIAVSSFTAGQVERRLGVPREKIAVCSPGAPPWQPRAAHASRGPILFMGTLEPRKNVGTLLEAYSMLIARMPDAPVLWLAGRAGEAATSWLRAIEAPPLAGHVKHLGYIEANRRYELYTQASMLVQPSHLEGFGIPVLEAMTAGVPVIVSTGGALPEVAGEAGPAVAPDDPKGFADAMERYLQDPGAVRSAVERGLARARHYSWDATARCVLGAYAKAIGITQSSERATASEPRERPAFAPEALRRVRRSFSGGGSGVGEVSPEPASTDARAKADGAKPPGQR